MDIKGLFSESSGMRRNVGESRGIEVDSGEFMGINLGVGKTSDDVLN